MRKVSKSPKVSVFARRLLTEWKARGWPQENVRLVVGVSGGADSIAVMLALHELVTAEKLRLSLVVAHFNHKLRGKESSKDAEWVREFAVNLGLEVVIGSASVTQRARSDSDNVEQAARTLRYGFLADTARKVDAFAVAVAHTVDDQAETFLMRLIRGSGADGLVGMAPQRKLQGASGPLLIRPLLLWARSSDTRNYCNERKIEVRNDRMNEDEKFVRVRVRRRLVPMLESFNPRIVEAISRSAGLMRSDVAALDAVAAALLDEASGAGSGHEATGITALDIKPLASVPKAIRRRALRLWITESQGTLRRVELVHIEAIEKLLNGQKGGRIVELPGGGRVERRKGRIYFRKASTVATKAQGRL